MAKIRRGLMILSVLFFGMGLIGFGVYTAVQSGLLSFSGRGVYRNNTLTLHSNNGVNFEESLGGGDGLNRVADSSSASNAYRDRGDNQFTIASGLTGFAGDVFVIGMVSVAAGGIEFLIRRLKRSTSKLKDIERASL